MIGVGDYKTTDRIRDRLESVMSSGRISYGEQTAGLEELWAAIHDVKHAIAVSSGTAALHVALYALKLKNKWKDGDSVLVPAQTFVATANVVIHCNLRPVFVDVERRTGLIDMKAAKGQLRSDTVAIMPVHLFGQAANMTEVMLFAERNGLAVVEDCAEAFGAMHQSKSVGSFGEYGCFSTYVAHHVPAGGGGVITTNSDELADLARSLTNHGRDTRYWQIDMADARPEVMFRFPYVGFNYRTTEWQSAVAMGLLADWESDLAVRRWAADRYNTYFADSNRYMITRNRESNFHSWMMYPMILRAAEEEPGLKFKLMTHLRKMGVDSREALPLLNNAAYDNLSKLSNADLNNHPNAKAWTNAGFYVPCHQYMTTEDVDRVIEALDTFQI